MKIKKIDIMILYRWGIIIIYTLLFIICVFLLIRGLIQDGFNLYSFLLCYCCLFLIFCILFYSTIQTRINRARRQKRTFNIITDGFKDGTISTENDLRRLFEVCEMDVFYNSFASFLDDYLVFLLREKDERIQYEFTEDTTERKPSYNKINNILSEIIHKEREEKPYDGVNERERKLLQDIEMAAKDHNTDAVNSGLLYLSNVLIENQKIFSKDNRRNSLLTKIGVIITIFSLIVAIIIFIIQNKHNLTSRDIKQNLIEVIDSSCVVVKDTTEIIDYRLKSNNVKTPSLQKQSI